MNALFKTTEDELDFILGNDDANDDFDLDIDDAAAAAPAASDDGFQPSWSGTRHLAPIDDGFHHPSWLGTTRQLSQGSSVAAVSTSGDSDSEQQQHCYDQQQQQPSSFSSSSNNNAAIGSIFGGGGALRDSALGEAYLDAYLADSLSAAAGGGGGGGGSEFGADPPIVGGTMMFGNTATATADDSVLTLPPFVNQFAAAYPTNGYAATTTDHFVMEDSSTAYNDRFTADRFAATATAACEDPPPLAMMMMDPPIIDMEGAAVDSLLSFINAKTEEEDPLANLKAEFMADDSSFAVEDPPVMGDSLMANGEDSLLLADDALLADLHAGENHADQDRGDSLLFGSEFAAVPQTATDYGSSLPRGSSPFGMAMDPPVLEDLQNFDFEDVVLEQQRTENDGRSTLPNPPARDPLHGLLPPTNLSRETSRDEVSEASELRNLVAAFSQKSSRELSERLFAEEGPFSERQQRQWQRFVAPVVHPAPKQRPAKVRPPHPANKMASKRKQGPMGGETKRGKKKQGPGRQQQQEQSRPTSCATVVDPAAARLARQRRRLARARGQAICLAGGDRAEIGRRAVADSSTLEDLEEGLLMDFAKNFDPQIFVNVTFEETHKALLEAAEFAKVSKVKAKSAGGKKRGRSASPPDTPASTDPASSPKANEANKKPKTCTAAKTASVVTPTQEKKATPTTSTSTSDNLKTLPSGKDPESRKLRRLMRNRLSAQASRDRRRKAIEDAQRVKAVKQGEIETLERTVKEEERQMMRLEEAVRIARGYLGREKYSKAAAAAAVGGGQDGPSRGANVIRTD